MEDPVTHDVGVPGLRITSTSPAWPPSSVPATCTRAASTEGPLPAGPKALLIAGLRSSSDSSGCMGHGEGYEGGLPLPGRGAGKGGEGESGARGNNASGLRGRARRGAARPSTATRVSHSSLADPAPPTSAYPLTAVTCSSSTQASSNMSTASAAQPPSSPCSRPPAPMHACVKDAKWAKMPGLVASPGGAARDSYQGPEADPSRRGLAGLGGCLRQGECPDLREASIRAQKQTSSAVSRLDEGGPGSCDTCHAAPRPAPEGWQWKEQTLTPQPAHQQAVIQGLTVKGKEEHILQKQEKQQNCDAQRHCVSPKIVETLHL
ncbi:MAG: hypothetical protein FRX49_04291 [Trebouxia sp. A1-2]|nr:MAG: hypothetical protein FRX49_04291 [Trebouxia sp. A1-2]